MAATLRIASKVHEVHTKTAFFRGRARALFGNVKKRGSVSVARDVRCVSNEVAGRFQGGGVSVILPGTGRWQRGALTEGAIRMPGACGSPPPSASLVPLPVPGRIS